MSGSINLDKDYEDENEDGGSNNSSFRLDY